MSDYVVMNGIAHRFSGYAWPFIETACGRLLVNAKVTSEQPQEPPCSACEHAVDYPESATRPDLHDYGPRK